MSNTDASTTSAQAIREFDNLEQLRLCHDLDTNVPYIIKSVDTLKDMADQYQAQTSVSTFTAQISGSEKARQKKIARCRVPDGVTMQVRPRLKACAPNSIRLDPEPSLLHWGGASLICT